MWKFGALFCLVTGLAVQANAATITIDAARKGPQVNPAMYGLFFEEINHGGDGGLYAEMVQNRSFEDYRIPEGTELKEGNVATSPAGFKVGWDPANKLPSWTLIVESSSKAAMDVDTTKPLNKKNPSCLRLDVEECSGTGVGIANSGFWGMGIKSGETYDLSFYAQRTPAFKGSIYALLQGADGRALSEKVQAKPLASDWKQFKFQLKAIGTDPKARMVFLVDCPGTVWFDMVSLFPQKTYNNRPNGFRPDVAGMLAGIKPGFMRWPGGCIVEGVTPGNMFNWKDTIGPLEERPGKWNLWGYRRTDGFGYHEFLQLCEDLHAEPLLVVNCGLTCFFRSCMPTPMDQIQPMIQDMLDAVEYANGPATSKWGALRARNGHPNPFNLRYVEIGNENWGDLYFERYKPFYDAVKKKYPNITTIANCPVPGAKNEIVDEHYYNNPTWFANNANKYDTYDRNGFKVFLGEIASTSDCGKGNLKAALGEAAFLTGAERNADVVRLVSYAPLFVNDNNRAWNPDAIVLDSSRSYGTPSYYLYRMLGNNRPDYILPLTLTVETQKLSFPGAIGVGSWATKSEYKDLTVSKNGQTIWTADLSSGAANWDKRSGRWEVVEGALRQTTLDADCFATCGDRNWTDYTFTLKARKVEGAEGFFVIVSSKSRDNEVRWNIGGWGNKESAVSYSGGETPHVPCTIDTGRWYDIKVELDGATAKFYLDGKLMHTITRPAPQPLYAVAGKDNATGDIILKVVNPTGTATRADVVTTGAGKIAASGTETVMTSASPEDENSFEAPTRIVPVKKEFQGTGSSFGYSFKPYSFTVLRLHTK